MRKNGISEEEKIAAERWKVCGKATDDLPLEENWARRVEECLAVSQVLGGEGRALEATMFLRPGSSDRVWQSRVLMDGAVEISSRRLAPGRGRGSSGSIRRVRASRVQARVKGGCTACFTRRNWIGD